MFTNNISKKNWLYFVFGSIITGIIVFLVTFEWQRREFINWQCSDLNSTIEELESIRNLKNPNYELIIENKIDNIIITLSPFVEKGIQHSPKAEETIKKAIKYRKKTTYQTKNKFVERLISSSGK